MSFLSFIKRKIKKALHLPTRRFLSRQYRDLLHEKNHEDIDRIPTHVIPEEKFMLYSLASMKKGTFVEIGSYLGASSCVIALALDPKTDQLFCVDTWRNETMPEGQKDTYSEFTHNTQTFRHLITPLRGKSSDIVKTFRKPISFLFIDGDHSYEAVKTDVELWLPHLTDNALVVFHDSCGYYEGVPRVIQEKIIPISKKTGRLPNLFWAWITQTGGNDT